MKKKIDMRKGYDDELVVGLPSATKLVNYGKGAESTATPSNFDAAEATEQLFLEGGAAEAKVPEQIELKPADEWSEDDDVDVFNASANSFMTHKMRLTGDNKVDTMPFKKSFWSWGSKTDGEQRNLKEKARLDFLSSYSKVIELAQRRDYCEEVEDREFELENLLDACQADDVDISEWL